MECISNTQGLIFYTNEVRQFLYWEKPLALYLSETHITTNDFEDSEISIPHYGHVISYSNSCHIGAVIVYIRIFLNFNLLKNVFVIINYGYWAILILMKAVEYLLNFAAI